MDMSRHTSRSTSVLLFVAENLYLGGTRDENASLEVVIDTTNFVARLRQ